MMQVNNIVVVEDSHFSKKPFTIKESPAAREVEALRRIIAKRKAQDEEIRAWRTHLETFKISKSCQLKRTGTHLNEKIKIPPKARQIQREAHRQAVAKKITKFQEARAGRLHLKTPKTSKAHQPVQADSYLKELYEYPAQSQTFGAQTEEIFETSEMSTGTDACTQVTKMDLFDFETKVTPIVETTISDVLRETINKMQYEYELAVRNRHRRTLNFERAVAEMEKLRLERENEMTRKTIAEHTQLFNEGEKNENARISKLPSSYGVDFLPRVVLDPNENGSTIPQAEKFVSWLMEDLQVQKTENINIEDILKNIQQDRKKEHC